MRNLNVLIKKAHSLVRREEWISAWQLTNTLLNENPENPELLYLAGCILRGMGNIGLSLHPLRRALSIAQNQPNLWMHYAACLHDLSLWDQAKDAFTVVNRMLPNDPMPPANIAAGYSQMGMPNEAIEWADKALCLDKDNHVAHIAKAFALLSLGRWSEAWEHKKYLYGRQLDIRVYRSKENEEPEWDGTPGQCVVVQCDQGLGDQIMFSQCIPELQKVCKEVIIECAPRMVPFFHDNFPGCIVYGTLKDKDINWAHNHEIDAHIHISYLGSFFRKSDSDFKREPYIKADPILKAKWLSWLEKYSKPYIGVAWVGGIAATQKHLRSLYLSDLDPFLRQPGTIIDLSYHDSSIEVAQWNIEHPYAQVIKPPIDEKNYNDTIALIAALDNVISVTTTVLHVRGALGLPCTVFTPSIAPWREAYSIDDNHGMIWYPPSSVYLERQLPSEYALDDPSKWAGAISRAFKRLYPLKLELSEAA